MIAGADHEPVDDATELERLREELAELKRQKEKLERERDTLRKENEVLKEQLEAQRMRSAAPFRVSDTRRKAQPKKPGRKPGHPGSHRPRPTHVDETLEVPLAGCPSCGGEVADRVPVEQFIEDIPEPRVRVTRLVTYSGQCAKCGPVSSRHPMQLSEATGAAATQVGPRALGVAVDLNKRLGVPLRKTCDVLREHFGIRLTAGALVQAEHRLAARLAPSYEALMVKLRASDVVYTDETSWWVGGPGWWLWVFTSPRFTFYVVDHRRNSEVVTEVLGSDFGGVLSSDCLNIYDRLGGLQNKCYAHHLKAIRVALEGTAADTSMLEKLRSLLVTAIALGKMRRELPAHDFAAFVGALEKRADDLLAAAATDEAAGKIANRLQKQRDHLFTFLRHEGVDPTNNAAERALRPAVVARKISCGNRTDAGRKTWQVLASLAATSRKQDRRFSDLVQSVVPLARSDAAVLALTGPPSR